jgi:hypothetical protein
MARTTVQGCRDRFVHLDSLEGHLHPSSQEDICQIVGDGGDGGQVQTQGPVFADMERGRYLDVSGAPLGIEHVQRLLYHQVDGPDGRRTLRPPPFFTWLWFKGTFFPEGGEAERRISFFASSLTSIFLPSSFFVACP